MQIVPLFSPPDAELDVEEPVDNISCLIDGVDAVLLWRGFYINIDFI